MKNNTYLRFNLKNKKEYIYTKEQAFEKETMIADIGKTFIDFLANSDDILNTIKKAIKSDYKKHDKLKDTEGLYTMLNYKLEKINPFFKYFNYDTFISDYVKKLKEKNNTEIKNLLGQIKDCEEKINYYNSQEYYQDLILDKVSFYTDYTSQESKKGFYYIEKAEASINKKISEFTNKYGLKPSYNTWKKLYYKNKNAIKGEKIIDELDKKAYEEHKIEICKKIKKDINYNIKFNKKLMNNYKHLTKKIVKENEKTIEEVIFEHFENIKFWIEFSKYILKIYYNLSETKNDNTLSSTQRLLNYLLQLERTYYNDSISKLPESNITLELDNGKTSIDLNEYINNNKKELLANYEKMSKEFSTYTVNIIQEYSINSIEDFICVSLVQLLQSNIKLCMCENCGKLFISVNKSNEKYCTYIFKGNKTCRDLSYSIHLQKNELSNILRKRYRTENAKKIRNHHIPKIEDKFQIWYAKAKEQKKLCENGKITIDDFNNWFEKNKKWF